MDRREEEGGERTIDGRGEERGGEERRGEERRGDGGEIKERGKKKNMEIHVQVGGKGKREEETYL